MTGIKLEHKILKLLNNGTEQFFLELICLMTLSETATGIGPHSIENINL